MKPWLITIVTCLMLACAPPAAARNSRAPGVSGVYKQVRESVVVIETVQTELAPGPRGRPVSMQGLGSGVIISKDGQVLTAAHVVQTADRIKVHIGESQVIDADVVRSDPAADVALLKLEVPPVEVTPAKMGNSDKVEVGDQVFVVGAPLGITHTLTVGHVSARRRPDAMLSGFSVAELFQTDAAINQGNSGGPMFNAAGEVVGIVSHIVTTSGGHEGLGFAVTSNATRELLFEQGAVWSGMSGYLLQGRMAELFNVPQPVGILVERVAKGSPAAALGLRGGDTRMVIEEEEIVAGGDIILEAFGITIGTKDVYSKLRTRMTKLKPGETIEIKVLRGGEIETLRGPYQPPS
jgi:S1-C subfamily serine protease